MLGTARIGHWEAVVVEWFWWGVGAVLPAREEQQKREEYAVVSEGMDVGMGGGIDHGVQEAEERNLREDASEWLQSG